MYATERRLTPPADGVSVEDLPGADAAGSSQEPGAPKGIPAPRKPLDDVTRRLAHCPQAVCTAREITAAVLDEWHVGEGATETALLVVSELVTNAVEHAQPPVALHLHRERAGSRVWMGVSDGGPADGEGDWTASVADAEHNRGLEIVDALATAHGICLYPGGTTHWARLRTTQA
ncbi:ATP-binding protein [Streptomyces sp. NPDC020681]|uniref:ATP-binding protein n=1 Tax=Streptomyces sp. NPDC020681 TaxID=3365083 RepID=UPI0037AA886D